jgi:hypothetical protein
MQQLQQQPQQLVLCLALGASQTPDLQLQMIQT